MREFGDVCHVVKITALECDVGKRDECGVLIDGSFERGEIGRNVIVACADANDLMAIAKQFVRCPVGYIDQMEN